eukprot:scaffold3713_cov372-Prasinococcus_capsulatus_cf.AAC.18
MLSSVGGSAQTAMHAGAATALMEGQAGSSGFHLVKPATAEQIHDVKRALHKAPSLRSKSLTRQWRPIPAEKEEVPTTDEPEAWEDALSTAAAPNTDEGQDLPSKEDPGSKGGAGERCAGPHSRRHLNSVLLGDLASEDAAG